MEVFDPSPPQVRRRGWPEGPRGGRGYPLGAEGSGAPARPQPLRVHDDGRLARNGLRFCGAGGGRRSACHPRFLVSLPLGDRFQWAASGGAGGGDPGVEGGWRASSGQGGDAEHALGAGRGWVGRGWLWAMAEALVRRRRQQAFGAADRGPGEWGRGQAPIPATSAAPLVLDQLLAPNTHALALRQSSPPPSAPGKCLQSLESWMDASSLSWRGRSCVTWGRRSAAPPP